MINTTLIGLLLLIMNTLGLNTVDVEQLEIQLNDEQMIQEARENGIQVLQPIEIYFMYGNDNGTYWLDVNAESENVIYVGYDDLIGWNIDYDSLESGNMMIGLFDETGWELIELISEDDLIKESDGANS